MEYTMNTLAILLQVRILFDGGYRRSLSLQYESYYVWYASLLLGVIQHTAGYTHSHVRTKAPGTS